MLVRIDPTSLRGGAKRLGGLDRQLHGIAATVRAIGCPVGLAGDTTGAIMDGLHRLVALDLSLGDQGRFLNGIAAATEVVGAAAASELGAGPRLPLRTPFPIPPQPKKKKPNRWQRLANGIGGFAEGAAGEVAHQVKGTAEGLLTIPDYAVHSGKVADAYESLKWISQSPENRALFLKALATSQVAGAKEIYDLWKKGDHAKAAGAGTVKAISALLPVSKLAEMKKISEVVKVAKTLEDAKNAPIRTIVSHASEGARASAIDQARSARKLRGIGRDVPGAKPFTDPVASNVEAGAKHDLHTHKKLDKAHGALDKAADGKEFVENTSDTINDATHDAQQDKAAAAARAGANGPIPAGAL